ncbi:MAG TPA: dihydrofolate reductase family protein [Ferruginibacter sp.]|jgi:dihydrofolate reductase|nr:dihydrofolate reductase family protein [Ferruginibacter sp.]
MSKITVFNFTTLNGYYKGAKEDISWHKHGKEENKYAEKALQSGNTLLFGRVTYQMMESFWPTPMASEMDPVVAKGMNESNKIVFSTTLKKVTWKNTTLVKTDLVTEVKKLKKLPQDITILGSGSIITQLAEHGLIDEYQVMIDPVALGKGEPMFKGLKHPLNLKLIDSKIFKSGVVLLCYKPIK